MELWDLLDIEGKPLGRTFPRGGELPQGTYHLVVEIYTVNSQGELLITKRSPLKESYPDMWEITGGSVLAGEDSVTAAVRELHEETGLVASPDDLTLLIKDPPAHFAFVDIYLNRRDARLSDLTMQEGETVAAKWVTFDELERMISDGEIPEPVARRHAKVAPLIKEMIK